MFSRLGAFVYQFRKPILLLTVVLASGSSYALGCQPSAISVEVVPGSPVSSS